MDINTARSLAMKGDPAGIDALVSMAYSEEPPMMGAVAIGFLSLYSDLSKLDLDRLSPNALHTLFMAEEREGSGLAREKAERTLNGRRSAWALRAQAASYLLSLGGSDPDMLKKEIASLQSELAAGIDYRPEGQNPSPSYSNPKEAKKQMDDLVKRSSALDRPSQA